MSESESVDDSGQVSSIKRTLKKAASNSSLTTVAGSIQQLTSGDEQMPQAMQNSTQKASSNSSLSAVAGSIQQLPSGDKLNAVQMPQALQNNTQKASSNSSLTTVAGSIQQLTSGDKLNSVQMPQAILYSTQKELSNSSLTTVAGSIQQFTPGDYLNAVHPPEAILYRTQKELSNSSLTTVAGSIQQLTPAQPPQSHQSVNQKPPSSSSLTTMAGSIQQFTPGDNLTLPEGIQDSSPKKLGKQSAQKPKADTSQDVVGERPNTQHVTFVFKSDIEIREETTLPMNTKVKAIKAELAKVLEVQTRNIRLFKDGRKMKNDEIVECPNYKLKRQQMSTSVISPISVEENEIVIEIGLDDSDESFEAEELNLDNIILSKLSIVPVKTGSGSKLKEVAVVKMFDSRQYLGGYRDKRTGKVYYHVQCQTEYKHAQLFSSKMPAVKQLTRETQTLLPLVNENVNTLVEKCTQMAQRDLYIPAITDKIMTSRKYEPYREKNKQMTPEAAVRILQKAWKFYIQKKRLRESYQAQAEQKIAKRQYKGTNLAEFHKMQLSLFTKDSFPTTRGDFYDLYTSLGEWKNRKVKKLKEEKSGFAYKVGVADLQEQETQGVLAIEEQRVRAKNENLNRKDIMFLEGTARSRVRQYPKGNVTLIDDENIQRARDIKEVYASYMRDDITKEERIEILSCIRMFLDEFEALDLTVDLIELIDREVDMIRMGIDDEHLSFLRKRFGTLFINLAKNPEFNPQAKYFKESSVDTKKYAKYKCKSCGKIMFPSQMFKHLRMKKFDLCTSCAYLQATATATSNLAPYKRLLTSLRAAEQEKCCRSALPFLLQPMGMFFLVNILWDGRSVISGSTYIPGLKVTRWLPNEEWSMWNMILLTEPEAHKHEKLADPLQSYPREFILNVANRNILGRMHFKAVADIEAKFSHRPPKGNLPKDHLLYTRRKDEATLPKNEPHPCLTNITQTTTTTTTTKTTKDAGN